MRGQRAQRERDGCGQREEQRRDHREQEVADDVRHELGPVAQGREQRGGHRHDGAGGRGRARGRPAVPPRTQAQDAGGVERGDGQDRQGGHPDPGPDRRVVDPVLHGGQAPSPARTAIGRAGPRSSTIPTTAPTAPEMFQARS